VDVGGGSEQWLFAERGHLLLLNASETSTLAWTSWNGNDWAGGASQFAGSSEPEMRAVVQRGHRLLAIVLDRSIPPSYKLYRTDDGLSWSAIALFQARPILVDVAADRSGFVVGGATTGDVPAVWTSPDGVRWSMSVVGSARDSIVRVVAGGGHILAFGFTGAAPTSVLSTWLWTGSGWRSEGPLPPEHGAPLVAASGSFVLFGPNTVASIDGAAWTPVPDRLPPGYSVTAVCARAAPYRNGLTLFAYGTRNQAGLGFPIPWLVKLSNRANGHTIQDINIRLPVSAQPG
jgi:hypothetical protein